ncbi:efflux RND transporter periplasmic adaptor subunit [Reinekea sp. G2M2-21]|uniref:efflux RND transporter periplasmic adaptor subunit n=1 Tax=Reinekea sp. G2M2-21 TaxID=2788942 RepID=UPI0018ABA876|nr:biotin/lipoyl-binding protein [Reinekea sp. G2M2-21]
MKFRWKGLLYPVLVVGVGVGIGGWFMANPKSSVAFAEQSLTVDPLIDAPTVATILPQSGQYAPQLQLYGQLRSKQQVRINSPASAEVLKVLVNEGDVVAEGDPLVELDTRSLRRQVDQLQARRQDISARRQAEAQQHENNVAALVVEESLVDIARRSVARLTDLKAKNLASASDLENAERTLQNQLLSWQNRKLAIARYQTTDQQFQAQLAELDSQIDQATEQLQDATVTAPFAATVSQVEIQQRANVQAGQSLMTLVDAQQQELIAWVSANALPANVSLNQLQGQLETEQGLVPVSLLYADPAANAGSLRLFFAAEQADASLTLNRYYRIWVDLPTQQAFAVPESSVYSNQYLYQLQDNQLQRVQVDVVGERFQDGQLWRLVMGELAAEPVLVTRLQNAAQGLSVKGAAETTTLAAAER